MPYLGTKNLFSFVFDKSRLLHCIITATGSNFISVSVNFRLYLTCFSMSQTYLIYMESFRPDFFASFPGESEILKFHGQKNLDANLNRQHMNPASNGRPYFQSIGKTYRIRNGYTVTLECSIENLGKKKVHLNNNFNCDVCLSIHKKTTVDLFKSRAKRSSPLGSDSPD